MNLAAFPKIGIVLVNLNSYDDTAVCLRSLEAITYPISLVIVVDNGSSDGSGERLREDYPNLVHIQTGENLGFTGGNNVGIKNALGAGCAHVLLLNNDTIVLPGFLEPLVERLSSDDKIAAVSGKIYYAPQTAESGGSDHRIWYAGCFRKWHMGYHHIGVRQEDVGQFDTPTEVPYASGCMMLMRGTLLSSQGLLSKDYFIYWEEADWCHRMRSLGYTCSYEPRSVIYHNFKSAELGRETTFYMYMQTRNAFVYAHKHYHGLDGVRFWTFYPIYLCYRLFAQFRAKNYKGARGLLWGVIDYFRGFGPVEGLRYRRLIKK